MGDVSLRKQLTDLEALQSEHTRVEVLLGLRLQRAADSAVEVSFQTCLAFARVSQSVQVCCPKFL